MQTDGNTVLITGGGSGIGLALAQQFLASDNTVVICGRDEAKLQQAKADNPGLHTRVADVSDTTERRALTEWLTQSFPTLNILVNNAGIQREFRFDTADLAIHFEQNNEIDTNFTAPVHLTFLLLPQLLNQPRAAVVNISSGLALIPVAVMPVYCATKAATQSFSTSLRYQLRETSVKVFDVAPPLVETDLDQGARAHRGQRQQGISPKQVAVETLRGMAKDNYDISIGMVRALRIASRVVPNRMLSVINNKASEA
jgi:uncharacterized oxidoreductase